MADIRLRVDEVKLCVKDAQLFLHGVRKDSAGHIVDHVDLILPWNFQHALTNLDGIDYQSINGETA